jgi:hypothetical protein
LRGKIFGEETDTDAFTVVCRHTDDADFSCIYPRRLRARPLPSNMYTDQFLLEKEYPAARWKNKKQHNNK